MKGGKRLFPLYALLVFLLFAGCAPVTPRAGDVIGTLRVSGPNVWLNEAPARDGDQVRLGSTLATGAGSGALVDFEEGGTLQLDENTDPVFEWLEQSKCILIRIFTGQAFLKKGHACVQGPDISLVLDSEANFLVGEPPAPSRVTLLRGTAAVTAPVRVKLLPGQQLVTAPFRAKPTIRTLSAAELRSVAAWRGEFRFKPLPPPRPTTPAIPLPVLRRPAETRPKPEPEPEVPTKPPGKPPKWDRGIRLPTELIERDMAPVIR